MNWEEVTEHLKAPLDPAAIKPPPQGKFGEYVDGLHVIREANRVFGFNGWSYKVTRLEQTHSKVVTLKDRDGPYDQLRCSFLCAVRVTVDGVTREGLAVGVGNGKPENAGDVIESAVKEAETDALKRAFRTFGNTFGLALYDKDKANRQVGKPEPTDAEKRDWFKGNITAATNAERLDAWWQDKSKTDAFLGLPQPMQAELQKLYSDQMGKLFQAPPSDGESGHVYQ